MMYSMYACALHVYYNTMIVTLFSLEEMQIRYRLLLSNLFRYENTFCVKDLKHDLLLCILLILIYKLYRCFVNCNKDFVSHNVVAIIDVLSHQSC